MHWDPVTHYLDVAVAERYDSERFSRLTGKIFDRLEKRYIARAFTGEERGSSVLDLPCGTGRLAEVLLEMGFRVTGIDISPAMLEVARRKLNRFDRHFVTEICDVRELRERGIKRFDLALCARVLMHFPLAEQMTFLAGVAAQARRKVVITHSLSTSYHRARRRLKRIVGNPPSVAYPVTNQELAQLLEAAGLREIGRLRPSRLVTEEIIIIAAPRNN